MDYNNIREIFEMSALVIFNLVFFFLLILIFVLIGLFLSLKSSFKKLTIKLEKILEDGNKLSEELLEMIISLSSWSFFRKKKVNWLKKIIDIWRG